jgi:hypothetical protein
MPDGGFPDPGRPDTPPERTRRRRMGRAVAAADTGQAVTEVATTPQCNEGRLPDVRKNRQGFVFRASPPPPGFVQ